MYQIGFDGILCNQLFQLLRFIRWIIYNINKLQKHFLNMVETVHN